MMRKSPILDSVRVIVPPPLGLEPDLASYRWYPVPVCSSGPQTSKNTLVSEPGYGFGQVTVMVVAVAVIDSNKSAVPVCSAGQPIGRSGAWAPVAPSSGLRGCLSPGTSVTSMVTEMTASTVTVASGLPSSPLPSLTPTVTECDSWVS